jgi:hypothetical protein
MVKLKENNLVCYYVKFTWSEKWCHIPVDLREASGAMKQ